MDVEAGKEVAFDFDGSNSVNTLANAENEVIAFTGDGAEVNNESKISSSKSSKGRRRELESSSES